MHNESAADNSLSQAARGISSPPPAFDTSQARINAICQLAAQSPVGENLLVLITELREKRGNKYTIAFDSQMAEHGVCFKRGNGAHVLLDPRLDEGFLASVLVHELQHVIQPGLAYKPHMEEPVAYGVFATRLREADAYLHQAIHALEHRQLTQSDAIFAPVMEMFRGNFAPADYESFKFGLARYRGAASAQDKQAAMKGIYWVIQEKMLDYYDPVVAERMKESIEMKRRQEGETPPPARPQKLVESCLLHLLAFQDMQTMGPKAGFDHYLGDDHMEIVERIMGCIKLPREVPVAGLSVTQPAPNRPAAGL